MKEGFCLKVIASFNFPSDKIIARKKIDLPQYFKTIEANYIFMFSWYCKIEFIFCKP